MRSRLVVLGLALCALPASGAPEPSEQEEFALTPIDELPTKDGVITLVGNEPIPRLRELILGQFDLGLQLRVIRVLPQFCTPTCKVLDVNDPPHPAREALLAMFASVPVPDPQFGRTGRDILRLRAGIEALGLARSGAESDLDLLVQFLNEPQSRDVRAAAAQALSVFCHPGAKGELETRSSSEPTPQVQEAIGLALEKLETCVPP